MPDIRLPTVTVGVEILIRTWQIWVSRQPVDVYCVHFPLSCFIGGIFVPCLCDGCVHWPGVFAIWAFVTHFPPFTPACILSFWGFLFKTVIFCNVIFCLYLCTATIYFFWIVKSISQITFPMCCIPQWINPYFIFWYANSFPKVESLNIYLLVALHVKLRCFSKVWEVSAWL